MLAFAKPHRVFGSITFCWWCSPGWWLLGCGFAAFWLAGCGASCSHLSTSWKPPQGQTPLRIQNNFPCAHRAKCWGGVGCWVLRSVGAQLTPVCWGHSRAGLVGGSDSPQDLGLCSPSEKQNHSTTTVRCGAEMCRVGPLIDCAVSPTRCPSGSCEDNRASSPAWASALGGAKGNFVRVPAVSVALLQAPRSYSPWASGKESVAVLYARFHACCPAASASRSGSGSAGRRHAAFVALPVKRRRNAQSLSPARLAVPRR